MAIIFWSPAPCRGQGPGSWRRRYEQKSVEKWCQVESQYWARHPESSSVQKGMVPLLRGTLPSWEDQVASIVEDRKGKSRTNSVSFKCGIALLSSNGAWRGRLIYSVALPGEPRVEWQPAWKILGDPKDMEVLTWLLNRSWVISTCM